MFGSSNLKTHKIVMHWSTSKSLPKGEKPT